MEENTQEVEVAQEVNPLLDTFSNPEEISPVSDMSKRLQSEYTESLQEQDALLKQEQYEEFSFLDKAGAAFSRENTIGSYLSNSDIRKATELDAKFPLGEYNPYEDEDLSGYEGHEDAFRESYNPFTTQAIKDKLDKEAKDREIMDSAMFGGIGYDIAATVLDPTQWLLAFGTGGFSAVAKGASVTAKAVRAGILAGTETAATEGILQSQQYTRTNLESAFNIGGATLFGGILGGGVGALSGKTSQDIAKEIDSGNFTKGISKESINPTIDKTSIEAFDSLNEAVEISKSSGDDLFNNSRYATKNKSASSAAVYEGKLTTSESLDVAGKGVGATSKAIKKLNPMLRVTNSINLKAKNVVHYLSENALILKQNYTGDLKLAFDKAVESSGLDNLNMKLTPEARAELIETQKVKRDTLVKEAQEQAEKDVRASYEGKTEYTPEYVESKVLEARRKSISSVANELPLVKASDIPARMIEAIKAKTDKGVSPREAVTEAANEVLKDPTNPIDADTPRLVENFLETFDDAFVDTQANKISAETISNKTQGKFTSILGRLEDTYYKEWKSIVGKGSLQNGRDEFNHKAFAVYNSGGIEPSNISFKEGELESLRQYASKIKKEISEPLEGLIEDYMPELWEQITFKPKGFKGERKLIDPNHLHRKYNTTTINDYEAEFKSILTKYLKENDSEDMQIAADKIWHMEQDNAVGAEGSRSALESKVNDLNLKSTKLEDDIDDVFGESIDTRVWETELEQTNELLHLAQRELDEYNKNYELEVLRSTPQSDETWDTISSFIISNIKGRAGILDPSDLTGKMDVDDIFKSRKIKLDNNKFMDVSVVDPKTGATKQVDFINTNLNYSMTKAIQGVALETAVARSLDNLGEVTWLKKASKQDTSDRVSLDGFVEETRKLTSYNDLVEYVKSDYVEALSNKSNTRETIDSIAKQMNQDLQDLDTMYDRLRGNRKSYQDPASLGARISKGMLSLTSTAYLGKVTLSALPDAARLVIRNGWGTSFNTMALMTKKKFKGLGKEFKKEQIEEFGVGVNAYMNKRALQMADSKGLYDEDQAFDRFLVKGTSTFFQLTGMNYWNDMMQTISSVSSINNMIAMGEALVKNTKVKEKHLAQARALGLSDKDMKNIYHQWVKAGSEKEGGVRLANIEKWDDFGLSGKFTNAVHKDSKQTIIEPSVGDRPSFHDSSAFGRHLTQFQGFISSSVTRGMLSGLQTDQVRFWTGTGMALILAHMSRYIKAWVDGDEDALEKLDNESLQTSLMESIDRSGAVPLASMTMRYLTPLVGRSITGAEVGRYAQMSQTRSAITGPSIGYAENVVNTVSSFLQGDTDAAKKQASRVIPFGNLPAIGYMTRMMRED